MLINQSTNFSRC